MLGQRWPELGGARFTDGETEAQGAQPAPGNTVTGVTHIYLPARAFGEGMGCSSNHAGTAGVALLQRKDGFLLPFPFWGKKEPVTALLRHSSLTIPFTHLQCTIKWLLVSSQNDLNQF